jgi:hypothetical protein
MASLNLQRNSEVFFSTVSLASGAAATAMTPSNTWKLEVLAGYALTSSAATQDITSMESGSNPDRSQQRFNISINPVDWNFQTYIRPTGAITNGAANTGAINTSSSGRVKPVADWFMWQSLVSNTPVAAGTGGAAVEQSVWSAGGRLFSNATTATTGVSASRSNFSTASENHLYFVLDNVIYQVASATVNQATVDAGIDSIATTTWTGQGTSLIELTGTNRTNAALVFGSVTGVDANSNASVITATSAYHPYNQMNVANTINTHAYIKNRLSILNISHKANATATADLYAFPVTALSFDYTNNITYLTPEELAVLNAPIGQFTGTRAVTGSATMYLRGGNEADDSSRFLRNISADTRTTSAQTTSANIFIGGTSGPYILFSLPAVQFDFPQLAADDVIAMTVNFVGQEPTASRGEGGEVAITAVKV